MAASGRCSSSASIAIVTVGSAMIAVSRILVTSAKTVVVAGHVGLAVSIIRPLVSVPRIGLTVVVAIAHAFAKPLLVSV
jgi:hypothetical protein